MAFARNARNIHTTVAQVQIKLENVLNEIDASESRDLNEVKSAIRVIAGLYKDLENETRSLVKRTADQAERVNKTADRVIKKQISPQEGINSMDKNFESLLDQLNKVKKRHALICVDLKEQALRAKTAKEQNDERAKRAEELEENAQVSAVLAIPGVSLVGAPVVFAAEFATQDSDDNTAVKVLKGAGGAVLGLGVGICLTAVSPFLIGYSAVCGARLAVLSRSWSKTFKDIEAQILDVYDIIDDSTQCLENVKSGLDDLQVDISQWNPSLGTDAIRFTFEDISKSSMKLCKVCEDYEQSLKSSKKRFKEITGTIKE